jgi:hypothetical protein
MPDMTITADDDVLRWARVKAAEEDTSVSRLVGDILRQRMKAEQGYQAARRRFLSVAPRELSTGTYPTRDELGERDRLR